MGHFSRDSYFSRGIPPICARDPSFSTPEPCHNQTDPLPELLDSLDDGRTMILQHRAGFLKSCQYALGQVTFTSQKRGRSSWHPTDLIDLDQDCRSLCCHEAASQNKKLLTASWRSE